MQGGSILIAQGCSSLKNISLASGTALGGVLGMGLMGSVFLMPIFLISVRGMREGLTGTVLFLSSLGMGLAGQVDVVDEASLATQQPGILKPPNRLADAVSAEAVFSGFSQVALAGGE